SHRSALWFEPRTRHRRSLTPLACWRRLSAPWRRIHGQDMGLIGWLYLRGNYMKHLKYLCYVLRHKWYVFIECCKLGIPIRGLVHDLSKCRPSEWFPYVNHFHNSNPRDKTGYYRPYDTGDRSFDNALFLHLKRNKHHWQWWVLPTDETGVKLLP